MPPFDREGALKSAEKALRQGRIDAAIAEYIKIVEAQPRDWNSANALGDLYARAGQVDKGVAQYTRIADHLAAEGFYPKAAALFKKILKVKPDDEYALLQSGEIAASQGTLADAKQYFETIAERRRSRGDLKGAAEISIRVGTLDPEDFEARLRAATAAAEMGDVATALREYRDVAARLEKQERQGEALAAWQNAFDLDATDDGIRARLFGAYIESGGIDQARRVARGADELQRVAQALDTAGRSDDRLLVLADIVAIDPANVEVKAVLALAYVAKGDWDRARTTLSAETAGRDPGLWLALAEMELRAGRFDEGRAAVVEAMAIDRTQSQAVVVLGCRLAEASPDAGYQCIEAAAEASLAEGDHAAAAVALSEFTTRVRHHLVALMRLVEICVDGGLEATMYEAQAQLADAYVEAGRGLEARIISEDLVAREPWKRANLDRFRRALVMLGESDPDGIIADRLSGESPFMATDKLDLNEGVSFDDPAPIAAVDEEPASQEGAPIARAVVPVAASPAAVEALSPASLGSEARTLDQVFRGLRDDVSRQSAEEGAAEQLRLALTYRDMGMMDDCIKALESAARSPRQRFEAASLLGHIYLEREETARAIDWLERAGEAPAPNPEAGRTLLYDLGHTLEGAGESTRALAVFMELEAEAGGYRDVSDRIERLSKVQARG